MEPTPLWNFIETDIAHGDYDAAVKFVCKLRDLVSVISPARGILCNRAIICADYEAAINFAMDPHFLPTPEQLRRYKG